MSSQITLKLIAEQPDKVTAQGFENSVRAMVASFGKVGGSETKRYWKMPDCFEVFIFLQPGTNPELAFEGILSSLGEGWDRHDISSEEQWAVWNRTEGGSFFSSHVRWATVERFPESTVISS